MTEFHNSYTQPSNFTIVQNELIRSPSFSCKAFKLLCIGLSHSGKWTFRKKQIATCFKEKEHTLDGAMKELRDLGYLHLKANRNENGKMDGHNWYWFTSPVSEEEFKLFLRKGDLPDLGNSRDSENQGGLRRPITKKTNLDKKNNNTPPAKEATPVVVFSIFEDLAIPDSLKAKLSSQMDDEKANKLVQRVKAWVSRESDAKACNTILGHWETWEDTILKPDMFEANKAWAKGNLKYTYKTGNHHVPEMRCEICSKFVEILSYPYTGQGCCIDYDDAHFKDKLIKAFEKHGLEIQ